MAETTDRAIAAALAVLDPEPDPDALGLTGLGKGDRTRWGQGTRHGRAGTTDGTTDDDAEGSSFDRIDLGEVVNGNYTQPVPEVLERSDGRHLFYRGCINGIHGDSGTGKGWVICHAITQVILTGERAMLIDLEDVPSSIVSRLRLLGLTDAQIVEGLDYRRPTEAFGDAAVAHLVADITAGGHALVVLDSLGEAFALSGINEDKDAEVGPWLRAVARPLADTGTAVVLVDHSTKAADNALHPSGSKRKRAAIGGASYLLEAVRPLKKGAGGRLRLTCAKDRHGNYARKEVAADLVLAPHDGIGPMLVELYAPDPTPAGTSAEVEVLLLAQKMIRVVKNSTTPMSKATLKASVSGRTEKRRAALEHAVNSGSLAIETGDRGAHLLRFVRDLEVPS
jgi:KaiC/GvpD/RAD55 family RecA-like ATPase